MHNNDHLYHIVSDIPALPPDLYSSIERDITRTARKQRMLLAAAAVLLISIVPYTAFRIKSTPPRTAEALPAEVLLELRTVSDYLNADDMEDYTALYTLVDNN